jgi:large subunit ribosomal protein L25
MDKIILSSNIRDIEKDKLTDLRINAMIPAVIYGAGKDNVNLKMGKSEFGRVYKKAGGNSIVELKIDEKDSENVLIYDIQLNPVTDEVDHVDFMRVRMDEEITATIPLEFVGMSIAVKDFGGIFNAGMNDIEVTCLPGNLPKTIEVSMDLLKTFEDVIRVKDLVLPKGVAVTREAEEVIASVLEPRSEAELAALNEDVNEDLEKVEVEEKGKKEEEEPVEGEEKK